MHRFSFPRPIVFPSEETLSQIQSFLKDYYFDMHGASQFTKLSSVIDEAALARLLTKLAVGSATVWWSLLELKEMVSLYQRSRKNKFHDPLS